MKQVFLPDKVSGQMSLPKTLAVKLMEASLKCNWTPWGRFQLLVAILELNFGLKKIILASIISQT